MVDTQTFEMDEEEACIEGVAALLLLILCARLMLG
jgi:hypothetical protein